MSTEDTAEPRACGGCLCGAVRYEIRGSLRDVVACHCGQCQRTHGGPASYSSAAKSEIAFNQDRGLTWYRSSQKARRGFCSQCGASLFWEPIGGDSISVTAGSLDPPSGLATSGHIFVCDKGDYYEIADDLPQRPRGLAG